MKRVVAVVVAVGVMSGSAFAAEWATVAKTVRESIVEIAIGTVGACSGFVIDAERDFVLTAAHCDNEESGKDLFVDLRPAKVVAKDTKQDLMVLLVPGIDRPALNLAKDNPKVGDEVASYGFGYALEEPLFRVAHVSGRDIALERSRVLAIDATFVGGQSGGPVVNAAGEVVMIVQAGTASVGVGVGAETMGEKVGRYFSKR